MSECLMNFTTKAKLSDEEFMNFYDRLWEETPHFNSNWPSQEQISENRKKGINVYNNPQPENLPNENWKELPGNKKYLISSKGRIKFEVSKDNYKLIEQADKYENRPGYLVLKPQENFKNLRINKTTEVYTFVAMAFLGKEEGDGLQVHHIHNNGYDCSTEELILLTVRQHKAVHLDQKLNQFELVEFLKDKYNEDRIKNHLANYKLNKLGIEECGVFKRNNKKYSHILPEDKKEENLILDVYKDNFLLLFKEKAKSLHKDFAHLNSSQALCFNLFNPLITEHKLSIIDSEISEIARGDFEHLENNSFELKEKTNFDFFINDNNRKYFFELKYTEQSFGYIPSIDKGHDDKYHEFYKAQLNKISKEEISEKEFFDHYQIWRNVCHSDIGKVFFVFLSTRSTLEHEVNAVIKKCKPEYQKKIEIKHIEEIVRSCLKLRGDDKFHKHYEEFYEKYLKNI